MYCTKCGQQIPNEALYCPNCGVAVINSGNQVILIKSRKFIVAGVFEILTAILFLTMLVWGSIVPEGGDIWMGGMIIIPIIVFGLMGGISAIRNPRSVWPMVGAAVTSIAILGIPALILLLIARDEASRNDR